MGESGGLYFPIKLRCADASTLLSAPEVTDALTAALLRSFSRVTSTLTPELAFGGGVNLHAAARAAAFEDDSPLNPDEWKVLLERVNAAIESAARAQSIPLARARAWSRPTGEKPRGAELLDVERFDPTTALYRMPSYRGGKTQVPIKAKVNPFERLVELYEAANDATMELHDIGFNVANPLDTRLEATVALLDIARRLQHEGDYLDTIGQIYLGNVEAESLSDTEKGHLRPLVDRYIKKNGQPFTENIAAKEKELQFGFVLNGIIRAHLIDLNSQLLALTDPDKLFLLQATMDVGTYYLQAIDMEQADGAARIEFLESFYADPDRIALYAVLRWARLQYKDNLKPNVPATIPSIKVLISTAYNVAIQRAGRIEATLYTGQGEDIYGDLPSSQKSVGKIPNPDLAARLSAEILQLEVELPVLVLWSTVESLFVALSRDNAGSNSDREEWFQEIADLEARFAKEVRLRDHQQFIKDVDALQHQIEDLHTAIYKAIRNLAIRRMIGEQLPLMFVGAGLATAVGAWVGAVTNGSKWLVVLSEAATLTVFNGVFTPAAQRPHSVLGWSLQFGENVLFAGMGQFTGAFGKAGGELAGELTGARRLLLKSFIVGGAIAGNSLVQTAVQWLESKAKADSGESSFTEMLSINLLMNVFGTMFGAAVQPRRSSISPDAFAALPEGQQLTELKASWLVGDDVAARWLKLRNRSIEYQQRFQRVAAAARKGTLTKAEFDQWRQEGLDLASDLEQNLDLVEKMGSGASRDQVKAMLDRLVAALQAIPYSAPVRPVPQLTAGLHQAGDGPTYFYDPASTPPGRLAALRSFFEKNSSVLALPGGGWEAKDAATGKVLFQAIPAPAEVAGLLPPSLDALATSETAKQGLARITAGQTGAESGLGYKGPPPQDVPDLRSQLAEASAGDPDAIKRLLELAGRGDQPLSKSALNGISNYLKRGGKAATLARAAVLHDYKARPDESRAHAERVLNNLATWGDPAVQGLEIMLNVVRKSTPTTSDVRGSLETLFGDVDPEQIKGAMELVTELAPRTRRLGKALTPLLSGHPYNERGGIGALFAAVELARRYPGTILSFEEPAITPEGFKRFQDIVVIEPGSATQPERVIASFEIKEVSTLQLGNRAPRELAVDIRLDAHLRSEQSKAGVPVGERFGSFRWRIRRVNLQEIATKQLAREGNANPSPAEVENRMNKYVKDQLRKAFDDPALKGTGIDKDDLKAYQDKFENDPGSFVEYF